MRKLVCLFTAITILMMLCVPTVAEEISTCADEVFWDACINLSSASRVTYTASTINVCDRISVSNCQLQQYVDGAWTTIATLSNPASITNAQSYLSYTNVAGYITSGTYRVVATFSADGHSITRTSNERTY